MKMDCDCDIIKNSKEKGNVINIAEKTRTSNIDKKNSSSYLRMKHQTPLDKTSMLYASTHNFPK